MNQIIKTEQGQIKLSERELMFCEAYLSDANRNGTEAAITAGYAKRTARSKASQLLTKVNIRQYLEWKTAPLLEKYGAKQEKIVQELVKVGFSNVFELFDAQYNLRSKEEIPAHLQGAVSQLKISKSSTPNENGGMDESTTVDVKVWDKMKALQSLAEMSGLVKKDSDQGPTNVQNNFYGQINNEIKGM